MSAGISVCGRALNSAQLRRPRIRSASRPSGRVFPVELRVMVMCCSWGGRGQPKAWRSGLRRSAPHLRPACWPEPATSTAGVVTRKSRSMPRCTARLATRGERARRAQVQPSRVSFISQAAATWTASPLGRAGASTRCKFLLSSTGPKGWTSRPASIPPGTRTRHQNKAEQRRGPAGHRRLVGAALVVQMQVEGGFVPGQVRRTASCVPGRVGRIRPPPVELDQRHAPQVAGFAQLEAGATHRGKRSTVMALACRPG